MHHYEVTPISAGRFIIRCVECESDPVELVNATQVHAYMEVGHELAQLLGIGETLVVPGAWVA